MKALIVLCLSVISILAYSGNNASEALQDLPSAKARAIKNNLRYFKSHDLVWDKIVKECGNDDFWKGYAGNFYEMEPVKNSKKGVKFYKYYDETGPFDMYIAYKCQ